MPMMLVDDESFIKEVLKLSLKESKEFVVIDKPEETIIVTSLDLLKSSGSHGQVVDIARGRGAKRLEVPESLRSVIAEEAILGTPNKEVAKAFGVSPSSVSAYKHDSTSTASYDSPNENLKKANDSVRTDITDQARSKLLLALEHVTSDKMQGAKLAEIASVANSMSGIIKNMEPTVQNIQNNTQVIVYKPRQREEDEFEVITVNE